MAVVGAGLVGSLWARMLGNRGHDVVCPFFKGCNSGSHNNMGHLIFLDTDSTTIICLDGCNFI